MESVECNCCGGKDLVKVYEQPDTLFHHDEWFDVVECSRCGLGFVNPRPSAQEIGKYYPKDFFSIFDGEAENTRRYTEQTKYLPAISRDANSQPSLLLDVGCANGDFPRFMRQRGWRVEGLEVSDNAAKIDDFPVYNMPLPEIPLNGPRYDAITAWAVLEHVHDPKAYFAKAENLLKPGGTFAFLITNFNSLSSRALFNEDIPRHLYFFTEDTLHKYLSDAGLLVDKIVHTRKIYGMVPANILIYAFSKLTGRKLSWRQLPESRRLFTARKGLKPSLLTTLRYAFAHPLTAIDRAAAGLYEYWQIWRRSYGIMVVVARKPH